VGSQGFSGLDTKKNVSKHLGLHLATTATDGELLRLLNGLSLEQASERPYEEIDFVVQC
jgi:hypothetical protein